jgi:hypothetical protein
MCMTTRMCVYCVCGLIIPRILIMIKYAVCFIRFKIAIEMDNEFLSHVPLNTFELRKMSKQHI